MTRPPPPPPAPRPAGWGCAICWVILGSHSPAVTTVAGDAVCADHVGLRIECESLAIAVREARADLGERPPPIYRSRR